MVLYGIKNCDTVRKARKWLDARGVEYRFHDLRADGLDEPRLRHWAEAVGWARLLNRRGMTWRKLDESERADLDADKALALMLEHPTLIVRPVLETGEQVLVGFNDERYAALSPA